METIIQQIVTKLTEEVLKIVKETSQNLNGLTELVPDKCKAATREIIQMCGGNKSADTKRHSMAKGSGLGSKREGSSV